jgi:hypothetical protein
MVYRIILRSKCTPGQTASGSPVWKTRLIWTGQTPRKQESTAGTEGLQSVLQVSPQDHTTHSEDSNT